MKKLELEYKKETGKDPKFITDLVPTHCYSNAYVKWLSKKIKHDRPTYDLKSLMRSSDKKIRETLVSLFRRKKDKYKTIFEKLSFEKIRINTETESKMYIVGTWGDGYDEFYTVTIYADNIHLHAQYHHSSDDKVIFTQKVT